MLLFKESRTRRTTVESKSGCGQHRGVRALKYGAGFCGLLAGVLLVAVRAVAQTTSDGEQAQENYLSGQKTAERFGPPSGTNDVAYWYGSNYRTAFVVVPGTDKAASIVRNAIEYKHASLWALGSTFSDVLVNQSNSAEPAAGGGPGATELYATLRSDVGLKSVAGSTVFAKGPLRDVSFELGANLETKNSSYAPAERTLYFGPKFQFKVPRGYVRVGLHLRKEWNHEGVLGKSESYDPDFNIEPTWLLPFTVGKAHLAYSGFADYNTSRAKTPLAARRLRSFLSGTMWRSTLAGRCCTSRSFWI
jgi:hypothetical protein